MLSTGNISENMPGNTISREPYRDLDSLLQGKDFFILTTNQDT